MSMPLHTVSHSRPVETPDNLESDTVLRQENPTATPPRPLLSIIIPVYNVEPWLSGCLQSVASQTLSPDLYEVILVNDKSTDGSLAICHEFCSKYSNFRLIDLTQHTVGGAGIPSNIGIDDAKGDYIGFVDSDDYIEPEMFDSLLTKAIQTKADLTICSFSIFNENTQSIVPSYDLGAWRKFLAGFDKGTLQDNQRKALKISPVPWRKLYRKDFLNEFHIRYPEGDYFFEDNPLHWYTVLQARSFAVVDKPLIIHRMARAGQTMSSNSEKFLAFGTHIKSINNFLLTTGKYEDFKLNFLQYIMNTNSWVLPKIGSCNKLYLADIKEVCKKFTLGDFAALYKNMNISRISLCYNYILIHCNYTTAIAVQKFLKPLAKMKHFLSKIKTKLLQKNKSIKRCSQENNIEHITSSVDQISEQISHKMAALEKNLQDCQKDSRDILAAIEENSKNIREARESLDQALQKIATLEKRVAAEQRTGAEAVWAHVFSSTVQNSTWFTNQTLSPGRWAVGYPFLYVLYRILDEAKPRRILELGLGQSTKMISQYAQSNPEVEHTVVEHDPVWIDFFSKQNASLANTSIVELPVELRAFNDFEGVRAYKGFAEMFRGREFDLVCIDAPIAGDMKKWGRIDILTILPDCFGSNFIVMIDDYNRKPEHNLAQEIMKTLAENGKECASGIYRGAKDMLVLCDKERRFLTSM